MDPMETCPTRRRSFNRATFRPALKHVTDFGYCRYGNGYLQYLRVVDAGCSGLGLGVRLLRVAVGPLLRWLLLVAIREIESVDVGTPNHSEWVGDAAGEFVVGQVEGGQPGQVTQRRGDVSV